MTDLDEIANEMETPAETGIGKVRRTKAVYANLHLDRKTMHDIIGNPESHFDYQVVKDAFFNRLSGVHIEIRHNLDELHNALEELSNEELIAFAEHHYEQKVAYVLSQRLKKALDIE